MKTILPFCLLLLASSVCLADKNVDISPVLAKPIAVVLDESFDAGDLDKKVWAAVKGDWQSADGAIVGKELKADMHAAVLSCQKKNRNSVVRFSFKLDDSTDGFHFSLNYARGHLFRALVSPTGLVVRTDADKKDKSIKSETIGSAKGTFEQGKWYTMQVEMVGNKVVVMTDNGLKVTAENARLDADKPNYRFVMRGESIKIDDVKIWNAE
ncbi:MAG: family 16 glycoside hydrolase [Fuerstiella sp.]